MQTMHDWKHMQSSPRAGKTWPRWDNIYPRSKVVTASRVKARVIITDVPLILPQKRRAGPYGRGKRVPWLRQRYHQDLASQR